MNIKLLVLIIGSWLMTGCVSFQPNVQSNNPSEAAIWVGAAIAIEKLSTPCKYGHEEDKAKCREKQKVKEKVTGK